MWNDIVGGIRGTGVLIEIVMADYDKHAHAEAILLLLDEYARDPMGGGTALSEHVKANLVRNLSTIPAPFSVLAFSNGRPAGLVNCFVGFSTFLCQPLVNIHDLVVAHAFRERGVGTRMLEYVEIIARDKGCCKLTLEVLEGNGAAQRLYQASGFSHYRLAPEHGNAQFLEKRLIA